MKTFYITAILVVFTLVANAQNWLTTGNSGLTSSNFLGTTDAKDLIFKVNNAERGRLISSSISWRFGSATNYVKIDSGGVLSFGGSGVYKVAGNKYAFQYSGNPNYGLFFNSSSVQYEFRNGSASPIFFVNANTGNGMFTGNLKIGAYTLPSTDGTNGQVLQTNGAGSVTWKTISGGSSQWITNGSNIYYSSGNVGIGTSSPSSKFEVSNGDVKINGITVGLGAGADTFNTVFGRNALYSNTIGSGNVAMGFQALYLNTEGFNNVGIGWQSLFSNTTGYINVAIGERALYLNSTGVYNIAIGSEALQNNTTGSGNIALGSDALPFNFTGNDNIAIGEFAMSDNETGNYNTAVGSYALRNNTSSYNTAVGTSALRLNSSGADNTGMGYESLYNNTTGNYNTAAGMYSMFANSTGSENTAFGFAALENANGSSNTAFGKDVLYSTTGSNNTGVGRGSLYNNTSGSYNTAAGMSAMNVNTTGSENTALGYAALQNTNSSANTALGKEALYANSSGGSNTASGYQALYSNSAGFYNTAAGVFAGYYEASSGNTDVGYFTGPSSGGSGNYNTSIGYFAGPASGISYSCAIGEGAFATASHQVKIGDATVTSIGGYTNWSNFSDGRGKRNIKHNVPGLIFINKLQPITYNLDLDALDKILQKPSKKDKDGKTLQPSSDEIAARKTKEKIVYTGFIAQDVEKAAKDLNYDFSGVDAPKNDKDVYGLRYAEFVVPLVKAVQELSQQNDAIKKDYKEKIDTLQKEIDDLKQLLLRSSSTINFSSQQLNASDLSSAYLEQNMPNPFSQNTIIGCYVPNAKQAQLIVASIDGKQLKTFSVNTNGTSEVTINGGILSAGEYIYYLLVDGKKIDSKKMILTR